MQQLSIHLSVALLTNSLSK